MFAIFVLLFQIGRNYSQRDESDNYAIKNLGYALLEGLPQVLTRYMCGDELIFKCINMDIYNEINIKCDLCSSMQNSIFLAMGDLPGNAVRYAQQCDGVRRDVRAIDLELMTFDW